VGEPREEDPVGGEVQGPQLHVGLQEEPVLGQGELEQLGQPLAIAHSKRAVAQGVTRKR